MRESDFQRWVLEVARRLGWAVWHVPAPMRWDAKGGKGFVGARDAAGLADLICVGQTRVLFLEIKGAKGKLSDRQQDFLDAVNAIASQTVQAFCFRPGDEDEVEALLRER